MNIFSKGYPRVQTYLFCVTRETTYVNSLKFASQKLALI